MGTALLNTVAASATASYLASHRPVAAFAVAAPVHGYTTGFVVSASILVLAVVAAAGLVRSGLSGVQPEVIDLRD